MLSAEQQDRLADAVGAVAWEAVEPSYRNPENPNCCCDQFVTGLVVTLWADGEVMTNWCDETAEDLPIELTDLLTVLREIGAEVTAGCEDPKE